MTSTSSHSLAGKTLLKNEKIPAASLDPSTTFVLEGGIIQKLELLVPVVKHGCKNNILCRK